MNCYLHFWSRTQRPISLAAGLLALLALASCRPLSDRQVSGAVLFVEGGGRLIRNGKERSLTKSEHFRSGDRITALAAGRADLMLLPGILIELTAESEIEIGQLHLERDGDETIQPMTVRNAHIRLVRGALVATVSLAPTESFLTIDTPAGSFTGGPDRTFRLKVSASHTWIMSVRGETSFQAPKQTQQRKLAPGFFANFPALPAVPPQRVADSGPEMQAQLVATLEVEKQLLLLQKKEGSAFRPW